MVYSVKEIYLTIQGEGAQTGRVAVFCRFAGCNLWSGREADRAMAQCTFCDTDFVGTDGPGGGKFPRPQDLATEIHNHWPSDQGNKLVVFTGGEPLLQLDTQLVTALHDIGFEIAVESNGTIQAPDGIDWLTISPKADVPVVQTSGQELKLVYPQVENHPKDFEDMGFKHFYLQPMDGPSTAANTKAAVEYCLKNPKWRLSVQTHKVIGID